MAFRDLSEEQKQARYDYNRRKRQELREAAIVGGYQPGVRERRSEEELAENRAFHNERRRKTMQAVYRSLRNQGLSPAEADDELEEIAQNAQFIQGPATYLGPDYVPGSFGSTSPRRRR